MQFHVPQFIDVEDKIFGPLTFKQFVYLIGGAGLCVIAYTLIPYPFLSYPLVAILAAFSLALAFYRVNDRPFIYIVQAAFGYVTSSQLYIWKRREHKGKTSEQVEKEAEQIQRVVADMAQGNTKREGGISNKAFAIDVGEDGPQAPEPEPVHSSPNRSAS